MPRVDWPARVPAWLGHEGLELVGLWTLAVAQPLLDLFGSAPTFFVANRMSDGEVLAFALIVCLLGPLVLIGIEVLVAAGRSNGPRTCSTSPSSASWAPPSSSC